MVSKMLVDFVKMEFFKLKGTKVFIFTLLLSLLFPLIAIILNKSFLGMSTNFLLDILISIYFSFLGFMLFIVVMDSLFNIDFKNHTLKSIIPLPVSKTKFLIGKLVTLFIWVISLSFIYYLASVILPVIFGYGVASSIFINIFYSIVGGTILLFAIMTPLVFVYIVTKSSNLTYIITFLLLSGDMIFGLFGITNASKYLPWSYLSSLVTGSIQTDLLLSYGIIVVVFIVGIVLSYVYINHVDIDL